MSMKNFFDEQEEQARSKSAIVYQYFWAWANVIIPCAKKSSGRIAYIDLFAGSGRYRDETKSTPILILERAIQDSNMRKMLVTMFNDKDTNNVRSLQAAVESIPGI